MGTPQTEDRDERLRQLRRVVLAAPENLFNMNSIKCGTAMCAAGWAASDPWFIDRGLRMVSSEVNRTRITIADDIFLDTFGALAEFFGIDTEDADILFAADACSDTPPISKLEVIDNIDLMLDGCRPTKYRAVRPDPEDQ
jgi:hypothetical protein